MTADTQPASKTVSDMTFFLCIRWSWGDIAIGVQMPRRIELSSIFAVDLRVTVEVPHVRDTDCAFWDEHAFVPIIFYGPVGEADWVDWAPSQSLLDSGADVREVG